MKSYPGSDEVFMDLGDKVINGLSRCVGLAAQDLREYRGLKPGWAATHSKRGLAGWIHDRIWAHLSSVLCDVDGVSFLDEEPHREIFVTPPYQLTVIGGSVDLRAINYRLRVKRHLAEGGLSTYPTLGALDFYLQPEPLPGLGEVRLTAGYTWNEDDRTIGAPVLSLRDGLDRIIWMEELPASASSSDVRGIAPPLDGPAAPAIEIDGEEGETRTGSESV